MGWALLTLAVLGSVALVGFTIKAVVDGEETPWEVAVKFYSELISSRKTQAENMQNAGEIDEEEANNYIQAGVLTSANTLKSPCRNCDDWRKWNNEFMEKKT